VRGLVDVAFVSTNRGKFLEAQAILRPFGVRLRWIRQPLVEPQADSLEAVARAKALSVRGVRGPVLVEDSGLFIPALGGFPGVYSAPMLRMWGFPPLLELLRRRPRAATFRAVAVLRTGGQLRTFVGEVQGTIARRPAGSEGFGYDPIFVLRGHRRTFAELGPAVKNRTSHRSRAMEAVGRYLARPAVGNRRGPGRAPRRR
jgi:XTP/dITP diphosphohydrolase